MLYPNGKNQHINKKDICTQTGTWHNQKTVQMVQLAEIREQETNGTKGCASRTN
jgi:hypothetical protein